MANLNRSPSKTGEKFGALLGFFEEHFQEEKGAGKMALKNVGPENFSGLLRKEHHALFMKRSAVRLAYLCILHFWQERPNLRHTLTIFSQISITTFAKRSLKKSVYFFSLVS